MAGGGAARTLRVALLGVKVQEARRYHVVFQVLAPGQAPAGVIGLADSFDGSRPSQVARTETCGMTSAPEFLNRVFVLRLPEPLGQGATRQFSLQCSLFASLTMQGPAGPMVGGQEVDELMGAATLQIGGDVAARLLRGERVTLPVSLGAPDQPDLLSSLGVQSSSAMLFGRGGREMLLELMLVDAAVTMPRDDIANRTGALTRGRSSSVGGIPSAPEPRPQECTLLVLVSRAENLPAVRGEGGGESPPSTFVAAKTLRDLREGRPSQSLTAVVDRTHNPSWGQLLRVQVRQNELDQERLHLAIVNDTNSKLMLKCALPVGHLLPGCHYNLRLLLPGGAAGGSVALYVTLCLSDAPKAHARRMRQLAAAAPRALVVQSLLTDCSRLLGSEATTSSEVFAVWRLEQGQAGGVRPASNRPSGAASPSPASPVPASPAHASPSHASPSTRPPGSPGLAIHSSGPSATRPPPPPPPPAPPAPAPFPPPPPALLETGSAHGSAPPPPSAPDAQPAAASRLLDSLPASASASTTLPSGQTGPLGPSPRASREGGVPPAAQGQGVRPPARGQGVLPAVQRQGVPPATLEACDLYRSVDAGSEDACADALRQMSEALQAAATASATGSEGPRPGPLEWVPINSPAQAGGTIRAGWPVDHKVTLLLPGSAQGSILLELHTLGKGAASSQLLAWLRLPLSQLPSERSGRQVAVQGLQLIWAQPAAGPSMATLELQVWELSTYEATLASKASQQQEEVADWERWDEDGFGAAALPRMAWQERSAGGGAAGGGGASGALLEVLVDDMVLKQLALERVVRAADANEARCEMAVWRLQDADNQAKRLAADNTQLRQLLHEEKDANRLPMALEDSSRLSPEELVERTEAALAAYGRERRRNAELVHRLQQMHAEQVDTLELKRRYHDLQHAHMMQSKMVDDTDSREGKLALYRNTIKTQEEVTGKLEGLLAQAVGKAKAAAQHLSALEKESKKLRAEQQRAKEDLQRVREERQRLREQLASVQSQAPAPPAMKAEAEEELHRTLHTVRTELDTVKEEHTDDQLEIANLRVALEQAEIRAQAVSDEMIDAIKRYAHEVAELKIKLSEKDAALMGGFGDISRLRDMDDDLGIPMIMMPPGPGPLMMGSAYSGKGTSTPPREVSVAARPPRSNSADSKIMSRLRRPGQEAGSPRAAAVKSGSPRPQPPDAARSSNPSTSTPPRRASPQLPRSAEGRHSPLAEEAQPRQPLLPPVAPPAAARAGEAWPARASPNAAGAAQVQARTTPPGKGQGQDQGAARPTATSDYEGPDEDDEEDDDEDDEDDDDDDDEEGSTEEDSEEEETPPPRAGRGRGRGGAAPGPAAAVRTSAGPVAPGAPTATASPRAAAAGKRSSALA